MVVSVFISMMFGDRFSVCTSETKQPKKPTTNVTVSVPPKPSPLCKGPRHIYSAPQFVPGSKQSIPTPSLSTRVPIMATPTKTKRRPHLRPNPSHHSPGREGARADKRTRSGGAARSSHKWCRGGGRTGFLRGRPRSVAAAPTSLMSYSNDKFYSSDLEVCTCTEISQFGVRLVNECFDIFDCWCHGAIGGLATMPFM